MSLSEKLNYLDSTKSQIKQAIINKGQEVSDTDTFREYVQKIENIQTGVDTSDATATADDIISPETAYVNGEKITGSIATIYETSELETQPRGITSSIYQHIFDYNPDYHIVLAADSYNPTIMYVLKEEDGVVGNIVETISTRALGESSDYTIYDAKIAHITNEDNTINIWFTYETMRLRVAKLDINNLTLVSYSNVCTISMNTSQTIAVNPANPNVVFWVSGKKGGHSNLFAYLVIGFAQLAGSNISISYNRECTSVGFYDGMFTFASTNISWSPDGKYVSYKTYLSMSTYFYGWFSELYYCSDSTSYVSDNITRILYNSNNNKQMDIGTNITATGNYSTTFISDDLVIFVGKLVRLYKENFTELKSLSYTTNPKLAGFNNYLFEFHNNGNVYVKLYDEETNDFIIKFSNSWGAYNENNQTTLKTPKSYNDYVLYNYNDAQINIWTSGISQIIKTLIRQDRTYINTTDSTAESEDILKGKTAYINNKKVKGTMPNNGTLNYTPTMTQQSIPAGYTSGGTIAAITDGFTGLNIPSSINVEFDREGEFDMELPTIQGINWGDVSQLIRKAIRVKGEDEWHYTDWEDEETGEYEEMCMEITSQYSGDENGNLSTIIGFNEDDEKYHINLDVIHIFKENFENYDFKLVFKLLNPTNIVYKNADITFNVSIPTDVMYNLFIAGPNITSVEDVTISVKDTNNNDIPYNVYYIRKLNIIRLLVQTDKDGEISVTYNGDTQTRTLDTTNNLNNGIHTYRFGSYDEDIEFD